MITWDNIKLCQPPQWSQSSNRPASITLLANISQYKRQSPWPTSPNTNDNPLGQHLPIPATITLANISQYQRQSPWPSSPKTSDNHLGPTSHHRPSPLPNLVADIVIYLIISWWFVSYSFPKKKLLFECCLLSFRVLRKLYASLHKLHLYPWMCILHISLRLVTLIVMDLPWEILEDSTTTTKKWFSLSSL